MPLSARQVASTAVSVFATLATAFSPVANADLKEDAAARLAYADLPIFDALVAKKVSRDEAEVYSGGVLGEIGDVMQKPRDKFTALKGEPKEGQAGFFYSSFIPATKDLPTSNIYACYGDKDGKPLIQLLITPEKKVEFISPENGVQKIATTSSPSPSTCFEGMKIYYQIQKHLPQQQQVASAGTERIAAVTQPNAGYGQVNVTVNGKPAPAPRTANNSIMSVVAPQ